MIQFNLLPDVKLEYIKTERLKRVVVTSCIAASAVALVIFAFLLVTVDVLQKKNMNDLTKDIATNSNKLKNTPNLDKILTIQNQLSALTTLHNSKPQAVRLFDYLSQITPDQANITSIKADFTANTLEIDGTAPSLDVVNTYADGLKFTTYRVGSQQDNSAKAFSNVVLTSFGRTDTNATYTLTMSFDHIIFDNANKVTLTVPSIISTRSVVEQPSIFKNSTSTKTESAQ